ncbi:MAG: hypothetical protein ACOCUQ_03730 [Bacteroidota bacterium]
MLINSCEEEEKRQGFDALVEKHKGTPFKNCEDFVIASEELAEMILTCIDMALEGNMQKVAEMHDFFENEGDFILFMSKEHERLSKECPVMIKEFEEKYDQIMNEKIDQLMLYMEQEKREKTTYGI